MNRSKQAGMSTKTVVALLVGLALASVRVADAQQQRDWLLLSGHVREKVFTLRLWLPISRLTLGRGSNWVCQRSLSVVRIRAAVCHRMILAAVAALIIAPKWLR